MKKVSKLFAVVGLAIVMLFAIACTPKNLGDAVEKLAEKGYEVEVIQNDSYFVSEDEIEDLDLKGDFYQVYAEKESVLTGKDLFVVAIIFEKKSDAKKVYEDLFVGEDFGDDFTYNRKGKVIYVGNIAAVAEFTD